MSPEELRRRLNRSVARPVVRRPGAIPNRSVQPVSAPPPQPQQPPLQPVPPVPPAELFPPVTAPPATEAVSVPPPAAETILPPADDAAQMTDLYIDSTANPWEPAPEEKPSKLRAVFSVVSSLMLAGIVTGGAIIMYERYFNPSNLSAQQIGLPADLNYRPLVSPSAIKGQDVAGVSFDKTTGVLNYTDIFEGHEIKISQQPLPDSFKTDPDVLKNAAQTLGAKEYFPTTKGTAYMITTEDSPGQVVVLHDDVLLLFMNSEKPHSVESWQAYIAHLKPVKQ